MQVLCIKSELQKSVQMTEKAAAVRSTLPVISNLLIETNKNLLTLTGYDLEVGIRVSINASVKKAGAFLVPAKTFLNIVSKLDEGEVELSLESKGNLKISNRKSVFNIHTLTPDEFPKLPEIKGAKLFQIGAKGLLEIVKQTFFAVSQDESKQVLNGIFIQLQQNHLSAVATDGYRLAKKNYTLEQNFSDQSQMIIPAKAVSELSRVLPDEEHSVKIEFSKENISFHFENGSENIYLISKLIPGQFPDYKQVIPAETNAKVAVNRKELMAASERSAIIASASANIIHLEVVEGQVHITANTPEVGTSSELLPAAIQGNFKDMIAFNVRLLLDALKIIDEDEVVLELSGKLAPGVLRPKMGKDYLYVVMPIRTAEPVNA